MVTVAVPSASGVKNTVFAGVKPEKEKSSRAWPPPVVGGVQLTMVAVIVVPRGRDDGVMARLGGGAWLQAGAAPTSPTAEDASNAAPIDHRPMARRPGEGSVELAGGDVAAQDLGDLHLRHW
jgi:hypothetical protein